MFCKQNVRGLIKNNNEDESQNLWHAGRVTKTRGMQFLPALENEKYVTHHITNFFAGTPTSVLTTPLFFSKSARAFLNGVGVLGTFSSHTFTDGV